MTIASRILPALPLAGLLMAGSASAETKASAEVGVEAGYGSNPFLAGTSSQHSGTIVGHVAPTISIDGPTTQIGLSGQVEHVIFTQRFPDMTNWSVASQLAAKLSPLSSLALNAGYSSRVQSGISGLSVTPPDSTDVPPIDPGEVDFVGRRIKNLNGGANFSSQISARDALTLSAFVSDTDYGGGTITGASNTSYGATVGLSHAINDKTSVGGSVSFAQSDYGSSTFGKLRQISPSANASLRLSPRTTLTVSAGASFSRIEQLTGVLNQTHFSGRANLCYNGDRSKLCAFANRAVGTSARAGSSTITAFGANYSYKLTPHSSLGLSGQYTQSSAINTVGNAGYGYAVFTAHYSQEIRQRLSVSVTARYTEPFKSLTAHRKGFYGSVGLNYRLGR